MKSRRDNIILFFGNSKLEEELKESLSPHKCKVFGDGLDIREIKEKVRLFEPDIIILFGLNEVILQNKKAVQQFIAGLSFTEVIVAGIKRQEVVQEALELGADIIQQTAEAYIVDIIALKVHNLIEQQERYEKKSWLSLLDQTFNDSELSDDEIFLRGVIDSIANNIDNYKFNVSDLSFAANLSERQLYRRVKSLTSYTPAALIREMRLQRAYKLVKQRKVKTKKELANKVGYKSVNHFSTAYKERFNEYIEC